MWQTVTNLMDGVLVAAGVPVEPIGPRWLAYGAELPNLRVHYQVAAAWSWTVTGHDDEAAALWATIDIDQLDQGVWGIVRTTAFIGATELAIRFGTTEQARHLYELLAPYAHQVAANPLTFGPVDLFLALLARCFGDLPAARNHIADAAAYSATHGITAWDRRIAKVAASVEASGA